MFKKKITGQALREIQEFNRVVNAELFKAKTIQGNTAVIPNGKKLAAQQFAIANLMKANLENLVAQRIQEAGIPVGQPVNLDLETGEIIPAAIQTA